MNEDRLQAARRALRLVGENVGLAHQRALVAGPLAGAGGVLLVPQSRSLLIRALVNAVPSGGWVGLVAVPDIGWEAAEAAGLDLSRTLVIADPGAHVVQCCTLMLEGVDVLCVESDALTAPERRRPRPLLVTHHPHDRPLARPVAPVGPGLKEAI